MFAFFPTRKRSVDDCWVPRILKNSLENGTIELYPDLALPEGFDHRIRPWYRAGMRSDGAPAWSPPYDEIITGRTIMSTTMPILDASGRKICVFAIDLTFAQLVEPLAAIPLPMDGVVYLADEHGTPFVGSDQSCRSPDALPQDNDSLLVYRTQVLQNGWRMALVVPRDSLVRAFTRAAVPRNTVVPGIFPGYQLIAGARDTRGAAQHIRGNQRVDGQSPGVSCA